MIKLRKALDKSVFILKFVEFMTEILVHVENHSYLNQESYKRTGTSLEYSLCFQR